MDKTNCQRSFSGYVSPTESRLQKKKPKLPPDLARHQHSIIALAVAHGVKAAWNVARASGDPSVVGMGAKVAVAAVKAQLTMSCHELFRRSSGPHTSA